jgi:hypothetical protein
MLYNEDFNDDDLELDEDFVNKINTLNTCTTEYDHTADNFVGFTEEELLAEKVRKFEKIKLARNILQQKGYNKAFARDHNNKYLWKSKDVRKWMRKLGFQFFRKMGKWVPKDQVSGVGRPKEKDSFYTSPSVSSSSPQPQKQLMAASVYVTNSPVWSRKDEALFNEVESLGTRWIILCQSNIPTNKSILNLIFTDKASILYGTVEDTSSESVKTYLSGLGVVAQDIFIDINIKTDDVATGAGDVSLPTSTSDLIKSAESTDSPVIPIENLSKNIITQLAFKSFDVWFKEVSPISIKTKDSYEQIKSLYKVVHDTVSAPPDTQKNESYTNLLRYSLRNLLG